MGKLFLIPLLLGASMIAFAGVRAADGVDEPAVASVPETGSLEFLDRDRLTDTLMADEQAEVDTAEANAEAAETVLIDAEADLEALTGQISDLPPGDPGRATMEARADELERRIETRLRLAAILANTAFEEAAVAFDDELAIISGQVHDMPLDTLTAFNRALRHPAAQGLLVDLDSDLIQEALDGAYDRRQINALVRTLESEARLAAHARHLTTKSAETGDAQFLEKAREIEARAMARKQQDLARIKRYENLDSVGDVADFEAGMYDTGGDGSERAAMTNPDVQEASAD